MAQKCVHKGCGKLFTDPDEPCVYHPGPPEFHEGQKGWKCCKPRVLTFEEFLSIPPCTTGKHSMVDTPAPESAREPPQIEPSSTEKPTPIAIGNVPTTLSGAAVHTPTPTTSPPPESESDDPSVAINAGVTCRRRGCNASHSLSSSRDDEKCIHHPGQPIFHEGSKGWSCCKRRVLEFDEFMKIAGCREKKRHLFIGKGKQAGEEKVDNIRTDFYQTATTIMATLYLKKIDKATAKVKFSSPTTIELDLPTSDNKRFRESFNLYAPIDVDKSSFQIMGTKMDLNLVKADGTSWPVLRKDDKHTGEIIQIGRAKKA
ncbi:hypothetical protein GX48_06239 [Paracoccidioides brasiliensis]|nr:hypothetical protein GX48_06239 [Paracoccidioides brasiliensis]